MTPEKLDRRLGILSWIALVALAMFGAAFAVAIVEDAPLWAVYAFVSVGMFAIVTVTAVLDLAQAWANRHRDTTSTPTENGDQA